MPTPWSITILLPPTLPCASFFVNDFFVDHGADGADALQRIGQQWASIPVSERFPHRFLEATVPSQRPAADVNTIHGADGAVALQGIGQQWAPFLLASVSPTGFLRATVPSLGSRY